MQSGLLAVKGAWNLGLERVRKLSKSASWWPHHSCLGRVLASVPPELSKHSMPRMPLPQVKDRGTMASMPTMKGGFE